MGGSVISRFVLLYFVVFMMALLLYNFPQRAIAYSPSFGMQEIKKPPRHWVDMWRGKYSTNGADYTDLRSVNYFSNGRFFNATLWLSSFNPKPPTDRTVNYGMYFDSDLNHNTGIAGIDYKVEISWNGTAKTWTRVFEFWSSSGGVKAVEKPISNYSGFYGKGDGYGYVDLSADLNTMLSPNRYKVIFYAEEMPFTAVSVRMPTWWSVFQQVPDMPEALVQGKELMYLSWFYHNEAYNPAAITQADINEFVSHYSAPGGMRAGFEYYRAFPQDAVENQNYSKTKLTMPVLALAA
jgi:hypothetical protein